MDPEPVKALDAGRVAGTGLLVPRTPDGDEPGRGPEALPPRTESGVWPEGPVFSSLGTVVVSRAAAAEVDRGGDSTGVCDSSIRAPQTGPMADASNRKPARVRRRRPSLRMRPRRIVPSAQPQSESWLQNIPLHRPVKRRLLLSTRVRSPRFHALGSIAVDAPDRTSL